MLKVPVWWLWILGGFVVIAVFSLRYFAEREEQAHGRYGLGTCLKNEEAGVVYRVEQVGADSYSLRVLISTKYPAEEVYRLQSEQHLPVRQVDTSSGLRPVPCPDRLPR